MTNCPCCSGKKYIECCEPVIKKESANSALKLMRSRYTAFVNYDSDYLLKTTHQTTREKHKYDDIEEWSKENSWVKLEIISQEHGNMNDSRGIVEFKAYCKDKNENINVLHERSSFLKENGKWFYVDGVQNPQKIDITKKVLRNDPCPCGSGKKQKKCCGKN